MTDDFEHLTSSLLRTMVVVTTAVDDERSGCLVGFHSQCSIDPPRYAVWLSKANHTYRVGVFADAFGVHFLTKSNVGLAELFGAETGDLVDKFASCEWSPGPAGVPLLAAVGNRLAGHKVSMTDDGSDHVCVVLDPLVVDRDESQQDWLLMSDIDDIEPGHPATDRQRPWRRRLRGFEFEVPHGAYAHVGISIRQRRLQRGHQADRDVGQHPTQETTGGQTGAYQSHNP